MKSDSDLPFRWDDASDWQLAPKCAWEAGQGELVRVFDTPAAALAFLAETSRAAINQRRYRQRQRRRVSVVPVPIADEVLAALLDAGRLDAARSMDRQQVAEEAAALLRQWAKKFGICITICVSANAELEIAAVYLAA